MELLLGIIVTIFPLIFSTNLVMALVKYLADSSATKLWLRCVLGVVALLGVIASASFTGNPIDADSLSNLIAILLETIIVAVGAHFSYKVIKES